MVVIFLPATCRHRRLARAHGFAVEMDGARAAQSRSAPEFRARQFQVLAHHPKQRRIGARPPPARFAVDRKRDRRHASLLGYRFLNARCPAQLLARTDRHVRIGTRVEILGLRRLGARCLSARHSSQRFFFGGILNQPTALPAAFLRHSSAHGRDHQFASARSPSAARARSQLTCHLNCADVGKRTNQIFKILSAVSTHETDWVG